MKSFNGMAKGAGEQNQANNINKRPGDKKQ